MRHNLAYFKKYTTLMDEIYKFGSQTAILDGAPSAFRAGNNANEVVVPKYSMQGLSKYDRAVGYTPGKITLEFVTIPYDYERGRKFQVDTMDNEETADIAFGRLADEFIRTQVIPEVDAMRFAKYCSFDNIFNPAPAALTGNAWYKAISKAYAEMTDAEVPLTDRYLFLTAEGEEEILNMNLTDSRAFMSKFAKVQVVPSERFQTAIELNEDPNEGGWKPKQGANKLNFMIIHKPALLQTIKHLDLKVLVPEVNPDADAWMLGYRIYGLNNHFSNKAKGFYINRSTQLVA